MAKLANSALAESTRPEASGSDDPPSYEEQKALTGNVDPTVRRELAAQNGVRPEILYYLAEDASPEVRRVIAGNEKTPTKANLILAKDKDEESRCILARKIARLAPNLNPEQQVRARQLTLEVLDILARDQLPRVRQIIAEEIRDCDNVSPELVNLLARDRELIVCAPILEFSPLLTDDDLIEIIRSSPVQGALSAVSRRAGVHAPVVDAIVAVADETAVAALLRNPSAQIREETLDEIIDHAPPRPSWHEPLVERPNLSHRAVKRIAQFVTASLLATLEKHYELDSSMSKQVADAVDKRLSPSGLHENGLPQARAERLFKDEMLDDEAIIEGLTKSDREFVAISLALKSGLSLDVVSKAMESQSAKSVVSLAWKAGLSMRTALQLQMRGAKIPHSELLNAKNGTDYPLSIKEMQDQLKLISDFMSSMNSVE